MSHADTVSTIISETLENRWYTTEEITAVLKDYWVAEKLTAETPIQYTYRTLRKLERRGEVECKILPYCKYAYWKMIE